MDDCIFCKIIKGEIPSYKLYEDDQTLAFLDAFPGTKGHSLVIPKAHYTDILDTPADVYANLIKVASKLAKSLKEALNYDGINIMQHSGASAGQTVFHIHVHLFPRWEGDKALGGWTPQKAEAANQEALLKEILPFVK